MGIEIVLVPYNLNSKDNTKDNRKNPCNHPEKKDKEISPSVRKEIMRKNKSYDDFVKHQIPWIL